MTVTKETIIKKIGDFTGWKHNESKKLVDGILKILIHTLGNGEDILISGFGKFKVLKKRARIGRNPHTLKAMKLDARSVVTFKASEILRTRTDRGKKEITEKI
jgi:integration host factor subunit alpha